MALEDFTTYTIAGTHTSKITVNGPHELVATDIERITRVYVYKDFGDGYFPIDADIEIQFELEVTARSNYSYSYFAGIGTNAGYVKQFLDNDPRSICGVWLYRTYLRTSEVSNRNDKNGGNITYNLNTPYYITFGRLANSLDWYTDVFSDPARQNQVGVRSVRTFDGTNGQPTRYLQPFYSYGTSTVNPATMYVRNMEIVKPSAEVPVKPNPLLFGQDF